MKILIISELFYPNNVIGALRPTKFAKLLLERGHEVDVFTRFRVSEQEVTEKKICSKLYGLSEFQGCTNPVNNGKKHGKLYKMLYSLYRSIEKPWKAKRQVNIFAQALKENAELGTKQYDAVFSSFGPLSSLLWGMYYKKIHPETRWICDFRDPVLVRHVHPLLRPYYRHLEKKACKTADAMIAVSNGYLARICRGKYQQKAFMLPNGYDLSDAQFLQGENQSQRLSLTYVGSLYGGARDLSPVLQALRELMDEGCVSQEEIQLDYAGGDFSALENQARPWNLTRILFNHGFVNREACLKLQASADMLMIATWNDKNEYGVFPGKMLEYMLIGKPIVSLTCGDLPNGEITQVIREGDFGVAYEAACHDADFAQLKAYLKNCYMQKKEQGKIAFTPKQTVLDRYNYENIITKLEEILQG